MLTLAIDGLTLSRVPLFQASCIAHSHLINQDYCIPATNKAKDYSQISSPAVDMQDDFNYTHYYKLTLHFTAFASVFDSAFYSL